MSVRELERLELYQLLLAPRGHTYQLAATLASSPAHLSLVSLWRRTCDFTDAEVEVVEVVRRAITAALDYRSAVLGLRALAGPDDGADVLTPRQRDVCRLVARGLTNAQVGRRLGISERTVRKHLEDVFGRTGCTSRTEVAVWWRSAQVADPPLSPSGRLGPR